MWFHWRCCWSHRVGAGDSLHRSLESDLLNTVVGVRGGAYDILCGSLEPDPTHPFLVLMLESQRRTRPSTPFLSAVVGVTEVVLMTVCIEA